jgi:hypothetical protein
MTMEKKMKGMIRNTVNKWWVLVLVATLALSLTSCGKKRSSWLTSGGGYECDGPMGYFGVSTIPYGNQGMYQVRLIVFQPDLERDEVSVTLTDSNTGAYRTLINGLSIQSNQEIVVGLVSQSELQTYDTLSVTPVVQSGTWSNQVADKYTDCDLPYGN